MNLRYVALPRVVRAAAPLVLPALLLTPGLASAQLAEEQVEPNLQILSPADLAVNINNFTFDYPEPYGDVDTTVTMGSIGKSVFETVDSLGNPVPLGVVYEDPPGINGDLSLAFTADGEILGCGPITNDLTGKIAFIERGLCFFNQKADHAENAGAVGVVIFMNDRTGEPLINMSAGDSSLFVGIPVVLIPRELVLPILTALEDGESVSGAICAYTDAGACLSVATEPGPAPGLDLYVAPNPFRREATLAFTLPSAQAVRVEVLDGLGRRVALLHEGPLAAGEHRLPLDGRALPPGVHLVRMTADGLAQTLRVMRLP